MAGLAAASYLLHHPTLHGASGTDRRVVLGEGVMILQISGELDIKEEDMGPARNPKWNYLITGTRISNLC